MKVPNATVPSKSQERTPSCPSAMFRAVVSVTKAPEAKAWSSFPTRMISLLAVFALLVLLNLLISN